MHLFLPVSGNRRLRLTARLVAGLVAFAALLPGVTGCESSEGYSDGTGNTIAGSSSSSSSSSGTGGSSSGSGGGSSSSSTSFALSPSSATMQVRVSSSSVSLATQRISVRDVVSAATYSWSLSNPSMGSLTATAGTSTVYTAPSSSQYDGQTQTVTCTETQPDGSTRTATCVITLSYVGG